MEIKLTEKEEMKKQRNDAMLSMYTRLLSEYPDIKRWRILRTIGAEFGLSPEGVKLVLVNMGAYINSNTEENETDKN